jgi:AraC-like DNA-binding protein
MHWREVPMSARFERVRESAEAILAGPALLRRWRTALRGYPDVAPLVAVLTALPSRLPTFHAIARRARVSEKSVRRAVLRAIGLTTADVLGVLRLVRIARRLAVVDVPVHAIAAQDFASTAALDHFFRRYFDCSPSEYRVRVPARRPKPPDRAPLGEVRRTSSRQGSTPAGRRRPSRSKARRGL